MKNFFIGRLLKYSAKKFDGYKTTIGGIGLILSGCVGLIGYMFPSEQLPAGDLESSFALIGAGCAALGIGGKAEKIREDLKQK